MKAIEVVLDVFVDDVVVVVVVIVVVAGGGSYSLFPPHPPLNSFLYEPSCRGRGESGNELQGEREVKK